MQKVERLNWDREVKRIWTALKNSQSVTVSKVQSKLEDHPPPKASNEGIFYALMSFFTPPVEVMNENVGTEVKSKIQTLASARDNAFEWKLIYRDIDKRQLVANGRYIGPFLFHFGKDAQSTLGSNAFMYTFSNDSESPRIEIDDTEFYTFGEYMVNKLQGASLIVETCVNMERTEHALLVYTNPVRDSPPTLYCFLSSERIRTAIAPSTPSTRPPQLVRQNAL